MVLNLEKNFDHVQNGCPVALRGKFLPKNWGTFVGPFLVSAFGHSFMPWALHFNLVFMPLSLSLLPYDLSLSFLAMTLN